MIFTNVLKTMLSASRYNALAAAAVAQAQAEVGESNGDVGVQLTKKQLAVSYVLAVAHAGENVPVPIVQGISLLVDLQVSLARALGLFGKRTDTTKSVAVPGQAALPL